MARSIKIADDVYQELGRFGNRDESWNDVVTRVLEHVDEDAALDDRDNRETTHADGRSGPRHEGLARLADGTIVRHEYRRGDYSGEVAKAEVKGDRLAVEGDSQETRSPTGAARVADEQVRGDDARGEGYNGWTWWEYEDDDGQWKPITTLTEDD